MQAFMLKYASQVLGQCAVVGDHTWGHRMSAVLRLRDSAGVSWILKRHDEHERYRAEVAAYRQWVPALGRQAPALRASSDELGLIIISAVPGRPVPWPAAGAGATSGAGEGEAPARQAAAEAAAQHAAGALLRRLHDGQPAAPWSDFGQAKADEFGRLAKAAAGLLTSRELRAADSCVRELAGITGATLVPCHRDYTPRNWLADGDALYVIDFEWARLDAWVSDLARLELAIWAGLPDLREAFLNGYGRPLSDTDQVMLRGCGALIAIWLVIKARETRQPSFEQASRAALLRLAGTR